MNASFRPSVARSSPAMHSHSHPRPRPRPPRRGAGNYNTREPHLALAPSAPLWGLGSPITVTLATPALRPCIHAHTYARRCSPTPPISWSYLRPHDPECERARPVSVARPLSHLHPFMYPQPALVLHVSGARERGAVQISGRPLSRARTRTRARPWTYLYTLPATYLYFTIQPLPTAASSFQFAPGSILHLPTPSMCPIISLSPWPKLYAAASAAP